MGTGGGDGGWWNEARGWDGRGDREWGKGGEQAGGAINGGDVGGGEGEVGWCGWGGGGGVGGRKVGGG